MSAYLNTITNTSSFTPEVQNAAAALAPSKETLQAAIDAAQAMDETTATLSGEQAELLKKGFEYATQVVKMLEKEPAPEEKLDVRFLFWGVGEKLFLDVRMNELLTGNQ